jgi:tRNA pseudouridine13 synthase
MKYKVNPEDFMVEEVIGLKVHSEPDAYRVYRLTKRNWNTIDAIRTACESCNVPIEKVRYGGRKDRFAATSQFITTPSDCDISFKRHNVSVELEGYSNEPMSTNKISGNSFTVTIRDMSEEEADLFHDTLQNTSQNGFVNYFDEQRFGGSGGGTHFFAELLIKRQYERAVKMLLCNCHSEAPAPVKKRKQNMANNWGFWTTLKTIAVEKKELKICDSLLKDSSAPGLLRILRDIPREEFGMHLSSYQSFIWNEVCSKLINETPEIKEIPTIAPDILPTSENVNRTIHAVLAKRGVRASKLNLAEFKECGYFSSFMRAVKVYPEVLETLKSEDDLFKTRWKLTTKFLLQAGSYATMLLKNVSEICNKNSQQKQES